MALPPDPDEMNDARARWALAAVREFQNQTGTNDCDAVADLIADLMHLCDRHQEFGSFGEQHDRAKSHYNAETDPNT